MHKHVRKGARLTERTRGEERNLMKSHHMLLCLAVSHRLKESASASYIRKGANTCATERNVLKSHITCCFVLRFRTG